MILCPSCGSTCVRNDYKPAPLALRMLFIRALLCDHCNHQFRAFSLVSMPARPQRRPARKAAAINQTPAARALDLTKLKDAAGGKESKAIAHQDPPRRLMMDLAALKLRSKTQQEAFGTILSDQNTRIGRDLKTEITRLHNQSAERKDREPGQLALSTIPDATACAHCGSTDVKMRRRRTLERMVFLFSDHKAFICRSCGETFYSKNEDDEKKNGSIGATEPSR